MSRNNTGNPIGSGDPRDREDNTKNLDEAVNSTASTWTDRLGVVRPTFKELETQYPNAAADAQRAETAADNAQASEMAAALSEQNSQSSAQSASDDADRAEAARDVAFVNADVYANTAAGLAGTSEGDQFQVLSADGTEYIRYRHDAGPVATEVARYPTAGFVKTIESTVQDVSGRVPSNAGGRKTHVFTDKNGLALASIDDQGNLFLDAKGTEVSAELESISSSFKDNNGRESIFAVTDDSGGVLFDADPFGGLYPAGSGEPLQNVVAGASIFSAMRYQSEGNVVKSALFFDKAENEVMVPISMRVLVSPDGQDDAIQRIPAILQVSDNRLLCIFEQIKKPVVSDGNGVRLVQCFIDYDLISRTANVSPLTVFEEQPGWADRLGAVMHPHLIKLPSGRVICVYNVNDAPSGLVTNRVLNIYKRHSDDDGLTWSDPLKIADAPGVSTPRIISTGSSGDFVRFDSGPFEGRIVFPFYEAIGGPLGVFYSDDGGETWTKSQTFLTDSLQGNESSIAVRYDGTLIMNIRTENSFNLAYATSNDGGESWTFFGARSNWRSSNCASSSLRGPDDPIGGYKKMVWSGLDNGVYFQRSGLVFRVSYDSLMSYQVQYAPVKDFVAAGYSNVRMIEKNTFAIAWENGFNSTNSIFLSIFNMAEVFKNGTYP